MTGYMGQSPLQEGYLFLDYKKGSKKLNFLKIEGFFIQNKVCKGFSAKYKAFKGLITKTKVLGIS